MVFRDDEMTLDRTEVLYGIDIIIKKTLETFSWMKINMDGSLDKDGPFLNVSHEPIWNGYITQKRSIN